MTDLIIVSRHPAAIEFITRHLAGGAIDRRPMVSWSRDADGSVRIHEDGGYGYAIPVLASATADDVRGKIVYGTLPFHLATLAKEVHAIEFPDYHHVRNEAGNITRGYVPGSAAPRGAEYTLAEMDAAGARLACYHVGVGPRRHDADIAAEEYLSLRCEITDGPRPGFKSVGVPSIEGHAEYFSIEERFLSNRGGELMLPVIVIGRDRRYDTALVQLPVEADSGANRVWVHGNQLVPQLRDNDVST